MYYDENYSFKFHTEKPIQPFYQVCDSGDSCSENIFGEEIKISLSDNFTDAEFEYKMQFIEQNMQNMDLDAGFGTALACVLTYKVITYQCWFTDNSAYIQPLIQLLLIIC